MSTPAPHRVIGPYKFKRRVGKGSFATVWLGEHIQAGIPVAIKVIPQKAVSCPDAATRFARETNLIKQMDHPFISKLYDIITDEHYTYLVMEYAENGNLMVFINTHGCLHEDQARRYFSQILSALEYLHTVRFVAHRDLKAENVLLDQNNNIRLIDFGLSRTFTDENPQLMTACGSPAYAAPEMVCGKAYTKAADIWSAGVLLYAMVVGRLPFDDDDVDRLLKKIAFERPEYPSFLSPQLLDLIQKLLERDPNKRMSLDQIKTHPWFSASQYGELLEIGLSAQDQRVGDDVDRDILGQMAPLGIDTKTLTADILCGNLTKDVALYQIFRRMRETDRLTQLMTDSARLGRRPMDGRGSSEVAKFASPIAKADMARRMSKGFMHVDTLGTGFAVSAVKVEMTRRLARPVMPGEKRGPSRRSLISAEKGAGIPRVPKNAPPTE